MITLHVLKLLEDSGFGNIAYVGDETGANLLFFEKLPIGKVGVFIMSRGGTLARGQRTVQAFDLYARGETDIDGMQHLEDILQFFSDDCYPICDLPTVPGYSVNEYKGSVIVPTSNIENVDMDETDRVIYVMSAQITYQKEQT